MSDDQTNLPPGPPPPSPTQPAVEPAVEMAELTERNRMESQIMVVNQQHPLHCNEVMEVEAKCGKCFGTFDDGEDGVVLSPCRHRFHVWCTLDFINKDMNTCFICQRPEIMAFPTYVYYLATAPPPPRFFSATYVIVSTLMHQLGHRPPHDVAKYHHYRQKLGLHSDLNPPPQYWHAPLLPDSMSDSERRLFIKTIYGKLDKPVEQLADMDALGALGMRDWGYTENNMPAIEALMAKARRGGVGATDPKSKKLTTTDKYAVSFEKRLFDLGHKEILYLILGTESSDE